MAIPYKRIRGGSSKSRGLSRQDRLGKQ